MPDSFTTIFDESSWITSIDQLISPEAKEQVNTFNLDMKEVLVNSVIYHNMEYSGHLDRILFRKPIQDQKLLKSYLRITANASVYGFENDYNNEVCFQLVPDYAKNEFLEWYHPPYRPFAINPHQAQLYMKRLKEMLGFNSN